MRGSAPKLKISRSEASSTQPCPVVYFNGIGFYSLSEAALSYLLEIYIPNFETIPDKTFQIPLAGSRWIDFCVQGVLVEYHQLRFRPSMRHFGDFANAEQFKAYRRKLKKLGKNADVRQQFHAHVREVLYQNYLGRRRALLEADPTLRGRELIVATTRDEFYEKVILRFAPNPPTLDEFLKRFWWIANLIAVQNGRKPIKNLP